MLRLYILNRFLFIVFNGRIYRLVVGYFNVFLMFIYVAAAFKRRYDVYILLYGSVSFNGLFLFSYSVNDYYNKFDKLVDVVVYGT